MFNPQILMGPNQLIPWPWLQVDDAINDFYNLRDDFKQYSPIHNEETTGREGALSIVMKNGDKRLTPKLQDFVANAEQWINEHTKEILGNWHGLGIGRDTMPEVQITRQLPSPYRFPIHNESDQKGSKTNGEHWAHNVAEQYAFFKYIYLLSFYDLHMLRQGTYNMKTRRHCINQLSR